MIAANNINNQAIRWIRKLKLQLIPFSKLISSLKRVPTFSYVHLLFWVGLLFWGLLLPDIRLESAYCSIQTMLSSEDYAFPAPILKDSKSNLLVTPTKFTIHIVTF
ncbi:unnamed protein product [Trifolium pratense]|uniref:Uncharacterized protein n=1 Tax=Trifolium pratense TaxID=57577 RepID=A0ACB0JLU6_TRIPR|nr:unnamed protein product [Trifolium pratense]